MASTSKSSLSINKTFVRLFRRFRGAICAQLLLLSAALVTVFLAVGFRLAEPWPLKYVFDSLMGEGATGFAFLDNLATEQLFGVLLGGFLAIVVAHTGLAFLAKLAMAEAFRRILAHVRRETFDHLMRMSILTHHGYRAGDLANRLTVDIDRLRLVCTNNAINLIVNVLTMAGMLGVMLWVNWQLALIAAISLPLFQLLTHILMPRIIAVSRRFRASDGALSSEAVASANAIQTIQGLQLHKDVVSNFERTSALNLTLGLHNTVLKTILRQLVVIVFGLTIALLLWRGAALVSAGALTPGDLIIFLSYLREGLEKPMVRFSANLTEIGRGAASGERLLTLLNEPHGANDGPKVLKQAPERGSIRFDNVSFGYPEGPMLLDRINLAISPGERIAILGASGSGKSTLIGLLLRLYAPDSGRVFVDDKDVRLYEVEALRKGIATVFQETALFRMTLRENLTFGGQDVSDQEVLEALVAARTTDFVANLSDGLDHALDEEGRTLSGGQRQRLGLARALLRQAPILVLDEPTSALDQISRTEIEASTFGAKRDQTVILITHHCDRLDLFDRVYNLENGRLSRVELQKRSTDSDRLIYLRSPP